MNDETTMNATEWQAAVKQMEEAGRKAGKSCASWLLDGNSTRRWAADLLAQCEGCSLDIPHPFSGEWADGLSLARVIDEETDVDPESLTPEEESELGWAFEDAYAEAYADEAERLARFYLAD